MLDAAKQAEILRLKFGEGLSSRKIAAHLGLNRKTVERVMKRRSVALARDGAGTRTSLLDPYRERIGKLLEEAPERSAVNILQRLREDGYEGGYTILKEYVTSIRPREAQEAYFKLEFSPGEAAQVDWGEFGDVWNKGEKVHVFVMVLCYSRKLYVEFTLRETMGALLRCWERALGYFGGVCREYWTDNMPTVVTQRVGSLVRYTDGFLAYAGFHGFKPVACNVASGNEKGRVEDGVKLVRYQFWPGRNFRDLDDLNRQAAVWREQWANRREHAGTGKVPELVFEQEKKLLRLLRPEPFETDDVRTCRVNHFGRVNFETNEYSVPWTLVGKTLTLRADDTQVRLYLNQRRVACHERNYGHGQEIVNPAHLEGLREIKPGAALSWQKKTLESWGLNTARYLELLTSGSRSLRNEIREFLALGTVYGPSAVEEAAGQMLQSGSLGVWDLEKLLRQKDELQTAPAPLEFANPELDFVPPSPNLQAYDGLLLEDREEDK